MRPRTPGLLSPELAAGIRRVKGVKQLGFRLGNWLSTERAKLLLERADGEDLRSIRDLAMIAVLLGCGLRRAELSTLKVEDMQLCPVAKLAALPQVQLTFRS